VRWADGERQPHLLTTHYLVVVRDPLLPLPRRSYNYCTTANLTKLRTGGTPDSSGHPETQPIPTLGGKSKSHLALEEVCTCTCTGTVPHASLALDKVYQVPSYYCTHPKSKSLWDRCDRVRFKSTHTHRRLVAYMHTYIQTRSLQRVQLQLQLGDGRHWTV